MAMSDSQITTYENFSNYNDNIGKESSAMLSKTEQTQKEIDEITRLKTQYNHIIDKYNSLSQERMGDSLNYLNRSDPSTNPYMSTNLSIKNSSSNSDVTGYVTQMGVFKPYPQDNSVTYNNTSGKNNCPVAETKLNKTLDNVYNTGIYLQTTPKLLVGTVMKSGQSCGFEGKNVYVNQVLPNDQHQYISCFENSIKTTLLGDETSLYDFNSCKQAAIDEGYQHFALKEVQDNGLGKCAATNNIADIANTPMAYSFNKIQLWKLNGSGSGSKSESTTNTNPLSYTSIAPSGSLYTASFGSNAKQNVNSTPISKDQMSNYIGCYADTPQRAITLLNNGATQYTYTTCMQEAKKQGNNYFGLQDLQPSGMAQCGITNDITSARKFGMANNCNKQTENNMPVTYGGGWSNAVYSTQGYSFYFLILQDDGNVCIYRGSGPQDNQGLIWTTDTGGRQKDPNPNYVATKGKNGQSWIASPNITPPNVLNKDSLGNFIIQLMKSVITSKDEINWIGSTDGSIYLMLEPDGSLTLNTSEKKDACIKLGDDMVSNTKANALNSLFYTGYPKNVGKFGYIDENSELSAYPDSMIKKGDTYEEIAGYNYLKNNIPGQLLSNSTVNACKTACNKRDDCAGFTYENSSQNCLLKNSVPYLKSNLTPDPRYEIYRRESKIESPLNTFTNIDSIQWNNYNKSGKNMTPETSVGNITFTDQKQLKDLGEKLNNLAKTINEKTTNLEKRKLSQQEQMELNKVSMKSMTQSFNSIEQQINQEGFINMNRVLEESKLVVNQEELNYAVWTSLVIVAGVVLMKVLQTND